ncbi:hypothetical protein GCM10009527_027120 [Actinomadura nitritigenes]
MNASCRISTPTTRLNERSVTASRSSAAKPRTGAAPFRPVAGVPMPDRYPLSSRYSKGKRSTQRRCQGVSTALR